MKNDTFTAERLQKVAEWLGKKDLAPQRPPVSPWKVRESWMHDFHEGEYWSDADLFCAIDDKCVAEALAPDLRCEWGESSGKRRYFIFPGGSDGPTIDESGPDRLSAALSAVLRMLEAP